MRTIEDKIIDALNGGNGVKNLSCRNRVEVDGGTKKYYLWNRLLFWNDAENIYYFSARGYNSQTTKSILHAILVSFFNVGINQKMGDGFLIGTAKNILLIQILSLYLRIINFIAWVHMKSK